MAKLKTLVIKRSLWRRGDKGVGSPILLNDSGFMCCLGFDAVACGVPEDAILRVGTPGGIWMVDQVPKSYLRRRKSKNGRKAVDDAIEANDRIGISESTRELKVRAALKKLGWDRVRFVD